MKQVLSFFILCAYVLAVIGGVGYTLMCKAYAITVSIVVLGIVALPQIKKYWKVLSE